MTYDYAIHSDFLIHWTGKDIDLELDENWYSKDKSQTTQHVTKVYLQRLQDILRYGLWMTIEEDIAYGDVRLPPTPKCCFTELKLSDSRRHAKAYGRLGIGVKRPFLFNRFGRPLTYFGYNGAKQDRLLTDCAKYLEDKNLLNFFKPMNSSRTLNYDFYSESEWRIIFFEALLEQGSIIDPRDRKNTLHNEYFNSLSAAQQQKLGYLIPLDGWMSILIYPSLDTKNQAQSEDWPDISKYINGIKSNKSDHGVQVEGRNWPIELNLDSCRNF